MKTKRGGFARAFARKGSGTNSAGQDVAMFALNFPPEPTGIAPYTGALATGLVSFGLRVKAHTAHPHYPEWKVREGYGQWSRSEFMGSVEIWRRRHYVPRSPRGLKRLLSELSFGARLFFASWSKPKVLIVVSPSLFSTALVVLRWRLTSSRPPLIVWVQDIYTLGLEETGQGGGVSARVIRWTEQRTLRAANRVVVIHSRFADYLTNVLNVDAARIAVIRNWAHLEELEPVSKAEARKALGWPADRVLAVHTGNMGVKQGLENVVEAARHADEMGSNVHFILVGDGAERHKLVQTARGTVRLSFVDPLDDHGYWLALNAADILIVNEKPGVSAMAVPSKLTSYFHASRPIVAATDHNGTTASEVYAAGAGVVVPAGEPALLLGAVLELGQDEAASALFSARGRLYRDTVLGQRAAIERWKQMIDSLVV